MKTARSTAGGGKNVEMNMTPMTGNEGGEP